MNQLAQTLDDLAYQRCAHIGAILKWDENVGQPLVPDLQNRSIAIEANGLAV